MGKSKKFHAGEFLSNNGPHKVALNHPASAEKFPRGQKWRLLRLDSSCNINTRTVHHSTSEMPRAVFPPRVHNAVNRLAGGAKYFLPAAPTSRLQSLQRSFSASRTSRARRRRQGSHYSRAWSGRAGPGRGVGSGRVRGGAVAGRLRAEASLPLHCGCLAAAACHAAPSHQSPRPREMERGDSGPSAPLGSPPRPTWTPQKCVKYLELLT